MSHKTNDNIYKFKNGVYATKDLDGNFSIIDKPLMQEGGKPNQYEYESNLYNILKPVKGRGKKQKIEGNQEIKLKLVEDPNETVTLDISTINSFVDLSQKAKHYSGGVFQSSGRIVVPKFYYDQKYFEFFKKYVSQTNEPFWYLNSFN